jgi:hypothetical protein
MPGRFTVTLRANGTTVSEPLVITMDPRVKAPKAALALQHSLSMTCYDGRREAMDAGKVLRALRAQLKDRSAKAAGEAAAALKAADDRLAALEGGSAGAPGFGSTSSAFAAVLNILHDADASPTSQAVAAVSETQKHLKDLRARFDAWKSKDLPGLNAGLTGAGLAPIAP